MQQADAPDIRPLSTETWDALAALFEEGGDPRWCWCAFWRSRGQGLRHGEARSLLRRLAERGGIAPGLVALRQGRAVGWVSLGPRQDFDRLTHSRVLAPIDEQPVWSVVCFVVSRRERRQGIARRLLDAAIAYAREHGATHLEAYPVDPQGRRLAASSAYVGTVGMFEDAGFEVAAVRQANRSTRPRKILRLEP